MSPQESRANPGRFVNVTASTASPRAPIIDQRLNKTINSTCSSPSEVPKCADIHRAIWIAIQDVENAKCQCEDPSYQYRTRVSQIEAFDALIKRYNLRRFNTQTNNTEELNGTKLRKKVVESWREKGASLLGGKIATFWTTGADFWPKEYMISLEKDCNTLERCKNQPKYIPYPVVIVPVGLQQGPERSDGEKTAEAKFEDTESPRPSSSSSSFSSCPTGLITPPGIVSKVSIGVLGDSRKRQSSDEGSKAVKKTQCTQMSTAGMQTHGEFSESDAAGTSSKDAVVMSRAQCTSLPDVAGGVSIHDIQVSGSRLDLRDIMKDLKQIHDMEREAVTSLLLPLSPMDRLQSPMPISPGPRLTTCYIRVWGEDWKDISEKLLSLNRRSASDVTTALVSACLFDNPLDKQQTWPTFSKQRVDTGLDHLLPNRLDCVSDRTECDTQNTHVPLVSKVAYRENSTLESAEHLAVSLCNVLDSHVRGLVEMEGQLCPYRTQRREPSLASFRSDITSPIHQALLLKTQLVDAKLDHTFFWPTHDESYDPLRMQVSHQLKHNPQVKYFVAFTIFPGVSVKYREGGKEKIDVPYKAVVIVY